MHRTRSSSNPHHFAFLLRFRRLERQLVSTLRYAVEHRALLPSHHPPTCCIWNSLRGGGRRFCRVHTLYDHCVDIICYGYVLAMPGVSLSFIRALDMRDSLGSIRSYHEFCQDPIASSALPPRTRQYIKVGIEFAKLPPCKQTGQPYCSFCVHRCPLTPSAAAGQSSNPVTALFGFVKHTHENPRAVLRSAHRQKTPRGKRQNGAQRILLSPNNRDVDVVICWCGQEIVSQPWWQMRLLARISRISLRSHQSAAPRRRSRRCVSMPSCSAPCPAFTAI